MITEEELRKAFEAKREQFRTCPHCEHELRLDFDSKQYMCDDCETVIFLRISKKDYKAPKSDMQLRIYNIGEAFPSKVIWIPDKKPRSTVGMYSSEEEDEAINAMVGYGD